MTNREWRKEVCRTEKEVVCVCVAGAYEYDMHEKWNSKSFYRFTDAIGIQHSLRNILLIATYSRDSHSPLAPSSPLYLPFTQCAE